MKITTKIEFNETCNNRGPGYRVNIETPSSSIATIVATPEAAASFVATEIEREVRRDDYARRCFAEGIFS